MAPNLLIKIIICIVILLFDLYFCEKVQVHPRYTVGWTVNDDIIEFEVFVETKGFIGLGISPKGDMKGSDIVIGGVKDNGEVYLEDRHATAQSTPIMDVQQDYKLIDASENDTHTYLKFSRLLNTCDDEDMEISLDGHKLIWSFGETDNIRYHGTENRGVYGVSLLDPIMPPPDLSKYKKWDMMSDLPLPEVDTMYWCTIHKTPKILGKHHMVGFDIVLPSKEAKAHTHHIDIYKCDVPEGESDKNIFDNFLQDKHKGIDCYTPEDKTFPIKYCKHVQYGWAIGGRETIFPDHAGFPFLGDDYYMMEVHYDNPGRLRDVKMTTGMEIYYTNEIREYDAAYLVVGSVVSFTQMIPPNSIGFHNTAHCGSECTNNFPKDGLNVFNILLHAHLSAQKIKVRHWRDGKEMPWFLSDENYDFNYQQNRPLREEMKIMPGDHLTVECLYDTTWKKGLATIGGRSTREEMCEAFFFYYPKMYDIVECNSELPEDSILKFLGIENITLSEGEEDPTVIEPEHLNGKKYSKVIEEIEWNTKLRSDYQKLHRYEPHDSICFPSGTPLYYKSDYPNTDAYVPVDSCQTMTDPSTENIETTTDSQQFDTTKNSGSSCLIVAVSTILMSITTRHLIFFVLK